MVVRVQADIEMASDFASEWLALWPPGSVAGSIGISAGTVAKPHEIASESLAGIAIDIASYFHSNWLALCWALDSGIALNR